MGGERIDQLSAAPGKASGAPAVGYIFQFYNLMPMLSAQRNVELPLLLTKLSAAERRQRAAYAAAALSAADRASHKPTG